METHRPDPTSDETTDPWDDLSSELSSLGERLRLIYKKVASEDGPTEGEIRSAFATLAGVWDQMAESLSAALDDPQTRAQLRRAAASLAAALGASISGLGEELERDG
ncbi:MAG TPA: hypothetical protein VK990_02570 [Acidimicrobiia bacterium]|nr:hypothetical protein [Acidimicrobiia bacterium]